jgi:hypothetical protein
MPNLRNNPFLILGISADAELQDIRTVAQRALMEQRLEGDAAPEAVRRIENALEALQDPVE